MLDRKNKPKTKKRTLHKRTRKHVKQFGGAKKPLNTPRNPLTSELHKKFKEKKRLKPQTISMEEQIEFHKLAGQQQQLNVHERHNNSTSIAKLIKRFGKSSQKNNPRSLSNKNIYTSPKLFYAVTNPTSI